MTWLKSCLKPYLSESIPDLSELPLILFYCSLFFILMLVFMSFYHFLVFYSDPSVKHFVLCF